MPEQPDIPISNMTGDQLIQYLGALSQKQAQFSKLKIDLIEQLKPIEKQRADLRADIQKVVEAQRQCKIEISCVKYSLKSCAEGLT